MDDFLNYLDKKYISKRVEKLKRKSPDYQLKSWVLEDNFLLEDYIKTCKVIYKYSSRGVESGISFESYQRASLHYHELIDLFGDVVINECYRIWHASLMRTSRLRKRISKMLQFPCIFLTLTFNDNSLCSLSQSSRKKYVKNYLKSCSKYYIANIDFGSCKVYNDKDGKVRTATNREHYHALVVSNKVDYSSWLKFGRINGQKVRNNISVDDNGVMNLESCERISKYINKLTNHAIKESVAGNRIIYSRDFNSL